MDATRLFNGVDGAPRIVAVIPLTEDANARESVIRLANFLGVDPEAIPETGLWRMR
jgi:pre-rRNA-processing protein TSR1